MTALLSVVQSVPHKAVMAALDFNVPDVAWRPSRGRQLGAKPEIIRRSTRALELLDGFNVAGVTQFVSQPTRGQNFLDLVVGKGLEASAFVHRGLIPSDHLVVTCDVRATPQLPPLVSRKSALNYKRADWDGMRRALQYAPWNLLDGVPVDEALETFYDLLTSAIRDHIPVVTLSRRRPPWFDRELRSALSEKEAAHRSMKRHRSDESQQAFNEKRRYFKQLTSAKFAKYLKGLVSDLSCNPKRFWTFLKCLKGKNSSIPCLIDGGRKVESDRAKADLLNRTFASKFSDPRVNIIPPAPDYAIDSLSCFDVSEDLVLSILLLTSRNKACGPDNVSARVVHECAHELAVPMTKLCRLSLEQGTCPKNWKRANVVPIFKKGDKSCAMNYRSVSLLPIFSKVLEKVVFCTLMTHVRPVLNCQQHGFMPGRSCITNLGTMLHAAWGNISAGSQTDVVYTDYSSAFQSVNHQLLAFKMEKSYHVTGKALSWLKSYLSEREQRVVVNGQCSAWAPVSSGAPEGGLLSPLLFACYVNDLPDVVRSDSLLFADDFKLYARIDSLDDVRDLQGDINRLCQWSAAWQLKLNPSKCKALSLTLRTKPIIGAYTIGGEEIERVHEMRDLGVTIDEKLTFGAHVDAALKKANRALGVLIRSFQTGKNGSSLYDVNPKAIISTYCANVRSLLEYGCVIWGGAASTHLKRAEKVQHRFLTWLCVRCRIKNVALDYKNLLCYFGLASLSARRLQYDIRFLRDVHNNKIDSSFLLESFPLAAAPRVLRSRVLFYVPRARVNTVKNSMFVRIPRECNAFLNSVRAVDIWQTGIGEFKKHVITYSTAML